jgi:hypothetical protein
MYLVVGINKEQEVIIAKSDTKPTKKYLSLVKEEIGCETNVNVYTFKLPVTIDDLVSVLGDDIAHTVFHFCS